MHNWRFQAKCGYQILTLWSDIENNIKITAGFSSTDLDCLFVHLMNRLTYDQKIW